MSRVINFSVREKSHEGSIEVIQNSIESSLLRLRDGKHEEELLNKEIKKLEEQILTAKMKKVEPNSDLKKTYAVLSKQIETSFAQLNSLQSENRKLKAKVEDMRLESCKYKRIIGCLQRDIGTSKTMVRACSNMKLREIKADSAHKEEINKLLSTSVTEKNLLNQKVTLLSTELIQNKEEELNSIKKYSETMIQIETKPLDFLDMEKIFERLGNHWPQQVKNEKKKIDEYKKTCEIIRKGFCNIVEAFGVSNYKIIAENFIISENQIKEMKHHLLNLNADIDSINFSNRLLISGVNSSINNKTKSKEIQSKLSAELRKLKSKEEIVLKKSSAITDILEKVEKTIDKSVFFDENFHEYKKKYNLDIVEAKSLEEKLQTLEQIIHQAMMHRNKDREKSSAFRKKRSSMFSEVLTKKSSFGDIKQIIESSIIPEDSETNESKLLTPITLRSNARRIYDQMTLKKRLIKHSVNLSVTPVSETKF